MDGRGTEHLRLVHGDGSDPTVSKGNKTESAKKKPSTEFFFPSSGGLQQFTIREIPFSSKINLDLGMFHFIAALKMGFLRPH